MPDRDRFETLWKRVGAADGEAAWAALAQGYGAPGRAYHNWAHIDAMLAGLDAVLGEAEFVDARFDEVELAIWFHDAVYDPLAKDNEAQSAALLKSLFGGETGAEDGLVERIAGMIEATATHVPSPDMSTQLVLDLDLQVLGATAEAYRRYVEAVRTEYAAVPDDLWRAGRPQVLRRFLQRPAIYQTRHFHDRLEKQARENISAEIEELET